MNASRTVADMSTSRRSGRVDASRSRRMMIRKSDSIDRSCTCEIAIVSYVSVLV